MSFLKDIDSVGKQDDIGQVKYNLNLDEKQAARYYKMMEENKAVIERYRMSLSDGEEG